MTVITEPDGAGTNINSQPELPKPHCTLHAFAAMNTEGASSQFHRPLAKQEILTQRGKEDKDGKRLITFLQYQKRHTNRSFRIHLLIIYNKISICLKSPTCTLTRKLPQALHNQEGKWMLYALNQGSKAGAAASSDRRA